MEADANDGGLLSAMTTEHFVLQSANGSTYAEASARSSLYVMALSSSLVAIGILSSGAERHFTIEGGRWPEVPSPAMRLGPILAFMGTTASMIAVTNNIVAGAGVALLTHLCWPAASTAACAAGGAVTAVVLTLAFYAYQRWRFNDYEGAGGQTF